MGLFTKKVPVFNKSEMPAEFDQTELFEILAQMVKARSLACTKCRVVSLEINRRFPKTETQISTEPKNDGMSSHSFTIFAKKQVSA